MESRVAKKKIVQIEKKDKKTTIRPLMLRLDEIEQRLEDLRKGASVFIDTGKTTENADLLVIVKQMSESELAEVAKRLSNQRKDIQAISKKCFQRARDKKVEDARLAEEARQAKILEEQTALQELKAIIRERSAKTTKSPKSFKLKRAKPESTDHLEDEAKDNETE